jgi:NitT/TauT family transport system substrate-binding protein
MKIAMKSLIMATGFAMAAALSVQSGFTQELQKVTARLAFTPGGIDAPFFVALGKGYFEEEGLDVEIMDGNGSSGTIQALTNGSVNFGNASLGALVQASATAGFDNLTAVFGLVQKDPSSIISLKGSGITTPKDIEGKRWGTEARNVTDGMLNAFAAANDVNLDSVEVIITEAYLQALLKGDVDFINAWANPDGDHVAAFAEIEEPILFADHGVNILGTSVTVRKDWLAENEDAVRGYLRALTRAHEDVLANPEEALELFMQARPDADREAIAQEMEVMEKYRHTARSEGMPFGQINHEDLVQTISLLEQFAGIPAGVIKPETVYTDAYQPAASN